MIALAALKGKARRRAMRLYRQMFRWDTDIWKHPHPAATAYNKPGFGVQIRDAHRLAEAGMVTAVSTKLNWTGARTPREVAIFFRRSDALAQYPKWALLPGKQK